MTEPDAGPAPGGALFCKKCGTRNEEAASFCAKCGAPLAEGAPAAAPPPPAPSGGVPGWVWVLIILGFCGVMGCIVLIIAAIAIPNLIEARKTGNETSAIGALRTISSVQAQFREGDREGDMNLDYATSLSELWEVGLIGDELGSGTYYGYVYSLSGSTYDWQCSATPLSDETGTRNFIVCTDGVVRFSALGQADCSSAAIE